MKNEAISHFTWYTVVLWTQTFMGAVKSKKWKNEINKYMNLCIAQHWNNKILYWEQLVHILTANKFWTAVIWRHTEGWYKAQWTLYCGYRAQVHITTCRIILNIFVQHFTVIVQAFLQSAFKPLMCCLTFWCLNSTKVKSRSIFLRTSFFESHELSWDDWITKN